MAFQHAIITHGGAGSNPKYSSGPLEAATVGLELLTKELSPLDAVVQAVRNLEDDPRFNAGLGSVTRENGSRIQLDASCMTSNGEFGAVAGVEDIQNPIDLAKAVLLDSPHILLLGQGAKDFAKKKNVSFIPLRYIPAEEKIAPSCDTVGAVAFDGESFAAALSTGGVSNAALGRVGDVPLPGCGLFCGPIGAVAATGDGEFIALKILAREVYSWLEDGMKPDKAATKALSLFSDSVDVGLIVLTKDSYGAASKNGMAWAKLIHNS